jgi:hypothetical protein
MDISAESIGIVVALCGVAFNFIRFGTWQGKIEAKVENLEKDSAVALTKFDVINKSLKDNNILLAELKVKLEVLIEEKDKFLDKHIKD